MGSSHSYLGTPYSVRQAPVIQREFDSDDYYSTSPDNSDSETLETMPSTYHYAIGLLEEIREAQRENTEMIQGIKDDVERLRAEVLYTQALVTSDS